MEDLAPIFPFIGTGLAVFTCCLIWGKLNRKWAKSFGYLLTVVVFSLLTMATYFMRLMYPELGTDNMAWFIPWGVGIWGLIAILNIIEIMVLGKEDYSYILKAVLQARGEVRDGFIPFGILIWAAIVIMNVIELTVMTQG